MINVKVIQNNMKLYQKDLRDILSTPVVGTSQQNI